MLDEPALKVVHEMPQFSQQSEIVKNQFTEQIHKRLMEKTFKFDCDNYGENLKLIEKKENELKIDMLWIDEQNSQYSQQPWWSSPFMPKEMTRAINP